MVNWAESDDITLLEMRSNKNCKSPRSDAIIKQHTYDSIKHDEQRNAIGTANFLSEIDETAGSEVTMTASVQVRAEDEWTATT